jgi:hypothetical protein
MQTCTVTDRCQTDIAIEELGEIPLADRALGGAARGRYEPGHPQRQCHQKQDSCPVDSMVMFHLDGLSSRRRIRASRMRVRFGLVPS